VIAAYEGGQASVVPNAEGSRTTPSVTRARFEELTHDLVQRCLAPVRQAMADARVTADDLDEVILVGGATRTPAVQALVRRLTGGKEPNMSVNPDEVVAIGAAIQAAVLKGDIQDVVLLDVTPLSLGLETLGGLMTRLVDRNTTIPTRRAETFSTAEDNQPAVDVVVLQGERERATDNRVLGRMRLDNIRPAPRGVPQIEVTFDVDANGILNVSARDRDTGAEQHITITESGTLDTAEVDRLVAEADRNRAQDQRLRQTIDARNELDSAAYQVEHRLTELADQAPSNEAARARMLIDQARQAINDETPIDRIRALTSDLQQILQSLNAATAEAPEGAPRTAGTPGTAGAATGADDVIDADYTTG
jgi:molecular chaperone DnaK